MFVNYSHKKNSRYGSSGATQIRPITTSDVALCILPESVQPPKDLDMCIRYHVGFPPANILAEHQIIVLLYPISSTKSAHQDLMTVCNLLLKQGKTVKFWCDTREEALRVDSIVTDI